MSETANRMPIVAVVDDDPEILAVIKRYFDHRQIEVCTAQSSSKLRQLEADHVLDLVILDLGLGSENGIDIARELRERSNVPLIILSGRDDTVDKVLALEIGADDYVTKPFELAELLARVRSLLRRNLQRQGNGGIEHSLRFDRFVFYPHQRRLTCSKGGHTVELTSGELQMLEVFLEHPNRLLTRDQILNWTHGREAGPYDRSVDMQIGRLRRKIEADPGTPSLIKTVRGGGYWFSAQVERM